MLRFDPAELSRDETYYLLTGLVVPRPIAWVSTLSPEGIANLAPFSYFNVVSSVPPIVHFTAEARRVGALRKTKDTLNNVLATGEFVINAVDHAHAEAMALTATDFPPDEDEFSWAGLAPAASRCVAPPRVATAPAAIECRVRDVMRIGDGNLVLGDVVHIVVDERVWRDGRVDPGLLTPLGRLSGSTYTPTERVLSLRRTMWASLRDTSQE